MVAMPTLGRHQIFSADAGLVLKNGAEKRKLATGYSLLRHSSVTDSSSIVNGGGSSSYGSTIWFPLKIPWFPWQICCLEKESNHSGKQVELPGSRSCSMGLLLLINGEMVAMPILGRHQIYSADAGLVLKSGAKKSKLATGYNLLRHSSMTDASSIVNGGGSSSYGSTIWFPLKIPWFPRQILLRLNALLKNLKGRYVSGTEDDHTCS